MLQIRLSSVPSSEGGTVAKHGPVDTVTVACPDHLVLAELPVAKGLGSASAASLVKTVGRRSRRQLGERVHFCVRCDFPIAIYGRLSPCDHAFCLDCARSDSICYLCDERIQKIQTIKMMEGIFVCAAPHCLKSFLKKSEFDSHVHKIHSDLLQSNAGKNVGNESEAVSAKQSASGSTARAPTKTPFSSNSSSQAHDSEDKGHPLQLRDQQLPRPIIQPTLIPPPYFGQFQNHPSESQPSHIPPQGFPPSFPPFNYPSFPPEGAQPFYGVPHEMSRPDSVSEGKSDQGSLLGFPPHWNMGGTMPGIVHGFPNISDPQGRGVFFDGDYRQNVGALQLNMPNPSTNKAMEMEGKGILAPLPLPFPPLPPMPPLQFPQQKQEE